MSEPVRVCSVGELPAEAGAVVADIDGRRVTIARDSSGRLHAFDDTCTHANVSLAEGEVEGGLIECWLHGSQFLLETGEPTSLPAVKPVPTYAVEVRDEAIFVDVTAHRH